jgi:hypothetical protein
MSRISFLGILPAGNCIKPFEDGMDKDGMLEFTLNELAELFWRVKEITVDSVNLSSSSTWLYSSDPTDNIPLADNENQLVCGPSIRSYYDNHNTYNEVGGVSTEIFFPFSQVYFDKTNNLYYVAPSFNALIDNDSGRYYGTFTPDGPGKKDSGIGGYPPDANSPPSVGASLLATANAFCFPYSDITKWPVNKFCNPGYRCFPDDNDHSIIGDNDGGGVECYPIGKITGYNSTYTDSGIWTLFDRTEPLGPYENPLAWNCGAALGVVGTFSYHTLSGSVKTCNIYGVATCGFNAPYYPVPCPYYTIDVPSVSCDASVTAQTAWPYNP